MNPPMIQEWHQANQEYLNAALAVVRERLRSHASQVGSDQEAISSAREDLEQALLEMELAAQRLPAPSRLDRLCESFSLSSFERDLLLLCAGVELDSGFASLCAAVQGDSRKNPSFGLAISILPEASWSAFTPDSPLRRWHLIEVGEGETLASSPLRINERVLHHILGGSCLDEQLKGMVEPVFFDGDELSPSYHDLARRIIDLWYGNSACSLVQLCGGESEGKRIIAASACTALGLQLYTVRAADIPAVAAEREDLARLWEREAVLGGDALVVDCEELDEKDARVAISFLERMRGMVLATSRQPLRLRNRTSLRLEVNKPSKAEQRDLWKRALDPVAQELDGHLEPIVAQFDLGLQAIRGASTEALAAFIGGEKEDLGGLLWEACRTQARPRLEDLAQRIEPVATWEDLVLPEPQLKILREIGIHVRQSARVYGTWGFATKGSRGLGISALFAGESGTGKTMAAEVLANDLELDLYRIDLSQVVSKYIGETEKNLRRVFDAAEEGGAILLFDEADALFGKRSEVKDSHDRHANIEVSYLLQRMEEYRGLAILTTNMRSALDKAFLRRIRFITQFPFPGASEREAIWSRIFPEDMPREGLSFEKLARLNVAGGSIRNIALYAAFLAAEEDVPVKMPHLLRAARVEYAKLERPLSGSEIGGWI